MLVQLGVRGLRQLEQVLLCCTSSVSLLRGPSTSSSMSTHSLHLLPHLFAEVVEVVLLGRAGAAEALPSDGLHQRESLNVCMFALERMVGLIGITATLRFRSYALSCVSMGPWISGTQSHHVDRCDSQWVGLPKVAGCRFLVDSVGLALS